MGLLTFLSNEVKAAVGYQQDFEQLLANGDVARALSFMHDHSGEAADNLSKYRIETHEVMKREDRAVYDKKGNFLRWSKRWKIPVSWQEYINEVALVFLYGRPVKWSQISDGTDDAFEAYTNWQEKTRFNAHVREAKRVAGAEGISAVLYHVYQKDGKPELLLKTLSKAKGDDIYTIKDQYDRLVAFGWGYTLTDSGNKSVRHIDIYTREKVYRCTRANGGWAVDAKDNQIGKIPVLLFEQEPESASVQPMCDRYENLGSVDADVNDRFSNPAMVASADVLNTLPKQEEEAKLFILKNGGKLEYLTWNQASESKRDEYERLEKNILNKSFTPEIDFDKMKSLGGMSAKAIQKVFLLAVIKAERRKETHDGYMNRHAHLMCAILGNVLDYKNKSKYDALVLGHEFQSPFGDDVSDMLNDVLKQYGQGALSLQTTLELSYLVKNAQKEYEQLQKEKQEAFEQQQELMKAQTMQDAFGAAE